MMDSYLMTLKILTRVAMEQIIRRMVILMTGLHLTKKSYIKIIAQWYPDLTWHISLRSGSMDKRLLLLVMVFCFIYLHKLQKLLRRSKVETHCQNYNYEGQVVFDCVACMNTQKINPNTLRFYVNSVNKKHETVHYYGNLKVLKQQKCLQYVCSQMLNTTDFAFNGMQQLLQTLTIKVDQNITINSQTKDEFDVQMDGNQAAVVIRFRIVQASAQDTTVFVTVRHATAEITERLAISLSGAVIPGVNYVLLLAFMPGLEGVMQAYMVWQILRHLTKNTVFPLAYALVYFVLSNLTPIVTYRNMYFVCNVVLSVITGVSSPGHYSLIGLIITVICVSSEYAFTTKDLVWTSTILGYYLSELARNKEVGKGVWMPVSV